MKINKDLIDKIFNNDPKKRIKIKNKKDIIKLSEYNEIIPMYDIYSEKIYPISKENIYYRLIYCHYRFINDEVKAWITNQKKKNKEKHIYNLEIISSYDLDVLIKTSYETLYKFSPELGLSISICKRNSFNKYFKYLNPYYTKIELLKLGMNMGVIKDKNSIDINNPKTHYQICKNISKNDISAEEIETHNKFIIDNNLITIISNFSFLGSYYMNIFLRDNENNSNNIMIDSINKLGKLMLNTPPLKNDYYLYRFIWDDYFLKDIGKGEIFLDKGFISTTRDPFYSPGIKSNFGLILLKIKIPAKKNVGLLVENFSLFPKEEEYLFPPYSRFKLLSRNDKFKYYHVNQDFENIITKKYEFEYVDNKFKEFSLETESVYRELSNDSFSGNNKIEIIKNFIKSYKSTDNTINIKFKDRNFKIFYNWFNGNDSYSKFYYNKNSNGMNFIVYDEYYFPYINIEFGDEMVINYLDQHFYRNQKRRLDIIDLQLIFKLAYIFSYGNAKLYLESSNFLEFKKDQDKESDIYLYTHLYNRSLYRYLKVGEKFYSDFKEFNDYIKFEYGYWKLNKLKTTTVPNEIYETYKTIIKSKENLKNLIIIIIENYFYNYSKLLEQIKKYSDFDILDNLYLKLDILSFYENDSRLRNNLSYDSNNMESDMNFRLTFGQNVRRVI